MADVLSDLYKEVKNSLTEEEIKNFNKRLLLLVHLSSLQMNIALDIETFFREKSKYKMTIKHNHERIKSFIRGSRNDEFWDKLTPAQIDGICDDSDTLEDIVFKWAGLK